MKHTLKFSVSTLYRQDSDFLLNTVIALMYLIPIALISWFIWTANYHSELSKQLNEANHKINKIATSLKRTITEDTPDKDVEASLSKLYADYSVALTACNISWAEILEKLEAITPNGIRFQRITIRPEKIIKLKLDGRAIDLPMLTDFLRTLYKDDSFTNPVLKNHRKTDAKNENSSEVAFVLDLVYMPYNEVDSK